MDISHGTNSEGSTWDCIVVGGGAAGLSAALALGRARRRTLVVDAGEPSNRVAAGIGGLLGQDGRPPEDFYATGRAELRTYPTVEIRTGAVARGERDGGQFLLTLADGSTERARRVLLATGMDYRFPELPGMAERWGGAVFHCPFCHGWEARDGQLAVLDAGPTGAQRAVLLRAWSDDVTLLTNGPSTLDAEAVAQLRAAGIEIDERTVAGVRGDGDALSAVVFDDGSERPCTGILAAVTMHQRSDLATQLGAATAPSNAIVADPIQVDEMLQTTVPGLYAAGDVSMQMPSVVNAMAAGTRAAAMIVHSLMAEQAGLTVAH